MCRLIMKPFIYVTAATVLSLPPDLDFVFLELCDLKKLMLPAPSN